MCFEANGRGVRDDRKQDRPLSGEPAQRLGVIVDLFGGYPCSGRSERDRVAGRVWQLLGAMGGVQVVVQDAAGSSMALLVGVDGIGELCGVLAQQVVEGIAAGGEFGEQTEAASMIAHLLPEKGELLVAAHAYCVTWDLLKTHVRARLSEADLPWLGRSLVADLDIAANHLRQERFEWADALRDLDLVTARLAKLKKAAAAGDPTHHIVFPPDWQHGVVEPCASADLYLNVVETLISTCEFATSTMTQELRVPSLP